MSGKTFPSRLSSIRQCVLTPLHKQFWQKECFGLNPIKNEKFMFGNSFFTFGNYVISFLLLFSLCVSFKLKHWINFPTYNAHKRNCKQILCRFITFVKYIKIALTTNARVFCYAVRKGIEIFFVIYFIYPFPPHNINCVWSDAKNSNFVLNMWLLCTIKAFYNAQITYIFLSISWMNEHNFLSSPYQPASPDNQK